MVPIAVRREGDEVYGDQRDLGLRLRLVDGRFWSRSGRGGMHRVEKGFDFRAETHPAITVSIRLGVNQASAATCQVGFSTSDFGRHVEGVLNGHADLMGSRSNIEKATARDVGGFCEVLGLIKSQSQWTKTEWDAEAVPFQLSAFGRGHQLLQTAQ